MPNHLNTRVSRWYLAIALGVIILLFKDGWLGEADTSQCLSIEHKPVKIEAWFSKRYEKKLPELRKEFAAMGNTRVTIWVYPAENPSKIVAIGRCVPVYIAQHTLRKVKDYFGNVDALVHQGFFSSNWIGVGASIFSENSIQPINSEEFTRLVDSSLDTYRFQLLYRQLTVQEDKVKAFGLLLDNPKLMRDH